MSNEVYANGREIACKAGAGKSICSFPDVCFTPPQTPATPPGVPIPYPNTGMDSDTTGGSKNVKISGKEVMLKDTSSFKTSTGDEAGCAPKKGLINSKNKGKVIFNSWSMDVKFEGENTVRHLDLMTHNHASKPANASIPWPFVNKGTKATKNACKGDKKKERKACKDYEPYKKGGKDVCQEAGVKSKFSKSKGVATKRAQAASQDKCMAARRCRLLPYDAKPRDGIHGCCPAQTGDHIIPKSSFFKKKFVSPSKAKPSDYMTGWTTYDYKKAPCMCLEGGSCTGSHGLRHSHHKAFSSVPNGAPQSFNAELKHCADGAKAVAPKCSKACIAAQLKEGHKGMGDTSQDVKHSSTGTPMSKDQVKAKINQMVVKAGTAAP